MPLTKLVFKPGINRDKTNYSQEGGWYACDKIRFRQGFPEKIGGWEVQNFNQYVGDARSLYSYNTLTGDSVFGIGTNLKMYVAAGTTVYDITPIRTTLTTPTTDNCFQTDGATTTVTVNITGHGALDNDYVTFSGATGPVGGIPASELNAEHQITYVDANSFTITVTTASTSVVAAGGGTAISAAFQWNTGYGVATLGYGWGTGTWGRSSWGSGSTLPIYLEPRIVYQDKYNNDLIFNNRGGFIYYWTYSTSFGNRAVYLNSIAGAVAVPQQVGIILFAPTGHLFAMGCTEYDAGAASPDYLGTYDPLLIRWSNVDATVGPEPEKWQPTATNTAGFLRLKSGSEIIAAINTRQETLVWTDYSLTSIQFLGTQEVFGLQELSASISIMGPKVVAEANNMVFWMGNDKFFVYSGRVDTLPCTLKRHVFDNITREQASIFFAGTNREFNEIIWFYMSGASGATDIDSYVIYNYQEQIWYYGSLERTAWIDATIADHPTGLANGWLYSHEKGNDDGQPLGAAPVGISAYIQSADIDIGDGDQFMLTRRVIPDVDFTDSDLNNSVTGAALTPEATITVGVRNFPGATVATTDVAGSTLARDIVTKTDPATSTAIIDQYTNQVYIRARGRQMNFKIESDGIGVQWQLGMPRVDARPDGRRG
jgi:hypothetical protein